MHKLLILIFLTSVLSAVTINVYNDSPYTLQAKIYSAKNKELSSMTVISGHSISYYDARDYTEGPFRVVFTCPNGDFYGKSSPVAQNSTVHAQRSRGPKKCGAHTQPEPHRDYDQLQPHIK
jgi:hypothetical protein